MGGQGEQFNFNFTSFFEDWMEQQRNFLHELRNSENRTPEELTQLVDSVLEHYQRYYEAKERVDAFTLFSPPWFSTFERSFLWITGFKPGLAFKILGRSVRDMSEEQLEQLEELKADTEYKEKQMGNEMALIQESLGGRELVKLTKEVGRQLDAVDEVVGRMKEQMKMLVHNADYCRMWIGREVVRILNSDQAVRFLTAAAHFQIRVREVGMHTDAIRGNVQGQD